MDREKIPTLEESEYRIDYMISQLTGTPVPPGPGERVTARITARRGADQVITEVIEQDPPTPEPGSFAESEARIEAALANLGGRE